MNNYEREFNKWLSSLTQVNTIKEAQQVKEIRTRVSEMEFTETGKELVFKPNLN